MICVRVHSLEGRKEEKVRMLKVNFTQMRKSVYMSTLWLILKSLIG